MDKAALLKDVERYPDAYQHERAKRFGCVPKPFGPPETFGRHL
nr:hypothetical protein [Candidatus Hamiltonella defensa]